MPTTPTSSNNTPSTPNKKRNWKEAAAQFLDKRALIMLMLGFSSGLPLLLIFSSLSLWLREAGVERSTVTMFGWAALGYSFKFIWAPLIDVLPLPILTKKLGHRRSWLLVTQGMIITAILLMANIDPVNSHALVVMALAAVLLGFSSATQDIVIDAYRIEIADIQMQSILSATYNAGYRIAMIVSGAGALFLAEWLGSTKAHYSYVAWQQTYWVMAAVMGVGVLTTLLSHEPVANKINLDHDKKTYLGLVGVFIVAVLGFIGTFWQVGYLLPNSGGVIGKFSWEGLRLLLSIGTALILGYILVQIGLVNKKIAYRTWIEPVADFFNRYGKNALLLLALIGLYRISDIVAGMISNVFYQDMGFSKSEIATAVKTFGVVMVIVGGFLGGLLSQRFRIMRMMMFGAILAAATNLLFIVVANHAGHTGYMYMAVTLDNLASGFAGAVFIAFLSALTNIKFTAVQYAIFSSIMTLFPKVIGGYSGTIVDNIGYPGFFTFTTLIGVPILLLVYLVDRQNLVGQPPKPD